MCLLLYAATTNDANAAEIKVLSSLGVKPAVVEFIPTFEQASGHRVAVDYARASDIAARIGRGEAADVVIVSDAQVEALEKQGNLLPGSRAISPGGRWECSCERALPSRM